MTHCYFFFSSVHKKLIFFSSVGSIPEVENKMDPVRLLFNSIVNAVYGEKQKLLNMDMAYEDVYAELCDAH